MIKASSLKRLILDGFGFAVMLMILISWPNESTQNAPPDLNAGVIRFSVLFLIGAFLSQVLSRSRFQTLGDLLFSPETRRRTVQDLPFLKSIWGWQVLLGSGIVLMAAAVQTQFSLYELLDVYGIRSAGGLFRGLLSPELSLLPIAVQKIIETVYIAFLATVLAVPIAFVCAFFAAKNIMTSRSAFFIYAAIRALLNISRSIEPVIWAIIFAVWVGVGPFAGMLALLVQSVASLTKQYSEHIESVDQGPIEGIRATGANTVQTIWYAIVPQVLLPYVSYTVYRWDINVRMATIIGFAGGGGIGTILYQYSMRAQWPEVGCIIAVIAAVVWIMDLMSAYIREALK